MTENSSVSVITATVFRHGLVAALIAVTAIAAVATAGPVATAPAVGDTYVYSIINGYNNETRGQVSFRVDQADANRVVFAVSTDRWATTVSLTPDGKWLRYPLLNHEQSVEYEFTPAYPSYEFPLESGKKWSTRVDAVNPATGKRNSVRVDATVAGTERIRVPAGEFDTIKIDRSVYAGDAESNKTETTIRETEWYAPSLGRSVRLTSSSGWNDTSFGIRNSATRGDWNVFELVSAPPPR